MPDQQATDPAGSFLEGAVAWAKTSAAGASKLPTMPAKSGIHEHKASSKLVAKPAGFPRDSFWGQRIICVCGAREACFTTSPYARLILVYAFRERPDLPLCQRKVAFPSA